MYVNTNLKPENKLTALFEQSKQIRSDFPLVDAVYVNLHHSTNT